MIIRSKKIRSALIIHETCGPIYWIFHFRLYGTFFWVGFYKEVGLPHWGTAAIVSVFGREIIDGWRTLGWKWPRTKDEMEQHLEIRARAR